MTARISRHFVTVDGARQVHYRRSGTGAPVILLHQSPTSSREYIPLIEELVARGHTVIAPDTPGNGMSDPLPGLEMPSMEDFADGVARLMTALGIERAPVYGFHTGGVCALALAARHPERVTVAIMDGYVQQDAEEKAEFLANYLPSFTPDWSGSHLTWAWARMREQSIFFPWYRKDTAHRMSHDLPPPAAIQVALMDFLRAGDNYRKAYRPAFAYDTAAAVRGMRANMVITTTATDVLTKYMDAMPTPPANVRALRPATRDDAREQLFALVQEAPAPQPAPAATGAQPLAGRIWADYLQIERGQIEGGQPHTGGGASLYCRRNTEGSGRPIVMIHASASSSFSMDRYMQPLIGKRPLLAVDLPGNGESDNPLGSTVTVATQAAWLASAIEAAGYDEVDVFGHWGGAAVGVELAISRPDLVRHLAVPTLIVLEPEARDEYLARYAPPIELDEYGAHLVRAWNMLRDQELFEPWYRRDREHIRRRGEPDIAPEVIHRRTVDLFKCIAIHESAYRAHFSYPSLEKLEQVGCPVMLGHSIEPNDFEGMARELLGFFGQAR